MAHGKHFLIAVRGVHREDSDARFRQLVAGFVAGLRTAGYATEDVVQDWHDEDADDETVTAAIAGQPTVHESHRERAEGEVKDAKWPMQPEVPSSEDTLGHEPGTDAGEPEEPPA